MEPDNQKKDGQETKQETKPETKQETKPESKPETTTTTTAKPETTTKKVGKTDLEIEKEKNEKLREEERNSLLNKIDLTQIYNMKDIYSKLPCLKEVIDDDKLDESNQKFNYITLFTLLNYTNLVILFTFCRENNIPNKNWTGLRLI